jgi:hypothetical protein
VGCKIVQALAEVVAATDYPASGDDDRSHRHLFGVSRSMGFGQSKPHKMLIVLDFHRQCADTRVEIPVQARSRAMAISFGRTWGGLPAGWGTRPASKSVWLHVANPKARAQCRAKSSCSGCPGVGTSTAVRPSTAKSSKVEYPDLHTTVLAVARA